MKCVTRGGRFRAISQAVDIGPCYDRAASLKERKQASISSTVNRINLYSNNARSGLASLENALKA